ncbi:FG-GAP repeat protein, partial [Candidatus Sumerlaeota bacterium]|nr:FG-GAP repeat protein [Candidatus Sumerlaeota bacterium]
MFSIRSFFRVMLGISVMCVILARRTDAECDLSALLQTLENPAPAGSDYFGSAAGISGNLAVVGAPNDDPGGLVDAGSAYVFNAATGAQLTTLNKPAPAAGDRFGASVAISGNLVVVGADGDDPGGINNAGRAYVFNATTGALVATLNNPNPAESDNFGSCVGISGNLAVVGARGDDPGGVIDAGSAYVFNATTGALIATLNNPAPVANDYFG